MNNIDVKKIIKDRKKLYEKNNCEFTTQIEDVKLLKAMIKIGVVNIITEYKDGKLIGIAEIIRADKNAKVMRVLVDKEYRNKGIGTKIIKKCIEWYKKDKISERLILGVEKKNKIAINLYKKLGFTDIKETKNLIYR